MKEKQIRLSPSSLNLYLECPRCFWLQINKGIHRPASPFSSLPSGMDNIIKKYFDQYRKKESLPPELEGKVAGKLLNDQKLLTNWRSWRTGLKFEDKKTGASLIGALDDCLKDREKYIPLDYKTRGFDIKEDPAKYYQNQLNCYSLLLEKNGFSHPSFAYLVYYIPKKIKESRLAEFDIQVFKIPTSAKNALAVFQKAVAMLKEPIPPSHSQCGFCSWGNDFLNWE